MNISKITIRNATVQDCQTIVSLGRSTQLETFGKDNKHDVMEAYLNENFNQEIILAELQDTHSAYFISEKNEEPIGYFKIRRDNHAENLLAGPNSIELQRIYIKGSEKGQGFGKQQLLFCENLAKEEGYDLIWLGVWEKNHFAREFYKKNGYIQFDSHIFPFGGEMQTDYMMRKKLV